MQNAKLGHEGRFQGSKDERLNKHFDRLQRPSGCNAKFLRAKLIHRVAKILVNPMDL